MNKQIIVAALVLINCVACTGSANKAKDDKATYEKQKISLAEREKANPADFIRVTGHDKKNLIGQTVVKLKLESKAAVAVYKDIEVELAFYSQTGALLEKDSEVVYETLSPGGSASFKTKYFAPKGTDSVALKVLKAKTE